jgi:hypothetical protein
LQTGAPAALDRLPHFGRAIIGIGHQSVGMRGLDQAADDFTLIKLAAGDELE